MSSDLKHQRNWVVTASLSVLAVVAIAFVVHYTRNVLIPLVVAIFVGSLVSPLMDTMELKYKFRHSVSVVIALIVVAVATALFGLVLMASIKTIVNQSQAYSIKFQQLGEGITARVEGWLPSSKRSDAASSKMKDETATDPDDESDAETATDDKTEVTLQPPNNTDDPARTATPHAAGVANFGTLEDSETDRMQEYLNGLVTRFAAGLAGTVVTAFSGGTLTLIFVLFILSGRDPNVVRQGVYAEIDTQVRSYIGTKVALSFATGVLVWVIFWSIGMPMAAVFGMLAFLLNFIPSVGSIIATVIPVPFALAMYPDIFSPDAAHGIDQVSFLLAVVLLPGSVQMLIGNVLEPKLVGKELQLHPITILLALAVWSLLWGPIGMLLAVPMTASIRIVLMKFEITQSAGRVLAGELPELSADTDATASETA